MAETCVMSEEFDIKKQSCASREEYSDEDPKMHQEALMQKTADLEARYEIARKARCKFMT